MIHDLLRPASPSLGEPASRSRAWAAHRVGPLAACGVLVLGAGRCGAGSWQYFAEWGSLGWTVERCRPALAWTASGLPAAAWSEGGMGAGTPAHAISVGWFDPTGTLQTREIAAIPATATAPVELIMRPGDRPVVLFVQEAERGAGRQLKAARAEQLAGPWKIEPIAAGAMADLTAAGTRDEGLARAAWFDEARLSLWFAEETPEGAWQTQEVTALGGRFASLILLPDDRPWIAFQGEDAATLWFAERQVGGAWRVEQVGAGGTHSSAALDAAGQPAVAHLDPLAELVLFQPFAGGLPGAPVPVYAGVVSQLAIAFDPVGRPHVAMSRAELVPGDPWCTTTTLFTLETAAPELGLDDAWTVTGVDSNLMGCIRAGCAAADFTRSELSWSPQGLPAILYQENCIAHPMAHRTVRLAFPARPWDPDPQPVITAIAPAADGGIVVTWAAAPDACYSLWTRPADGGAWVPLARDLCALPGQETYTHPLPDGTLLAGAWIRVTRDYP